MGKRLDFFTPLHTRTKREYLPRMIDDKVHCMRKAKEYEADYWDGDRRYGYGGYRYDGRWQPLARRVIDHYGLTNDSAVLDVGCGKAFLLHELRALLPGIRLAGCDISRHALREAPESVRGDLFHHRAQDPLPFGDKAFDLVVSMGCLHNLRVFELSTALGEIQRLADNAYVLVESYRDEQELFNLQCWALTCESFFDDAEWVWLYEHFGYTGDYEFIYFE
ncbi:class I SAM-dependent methyltransferase [Solidesulfovibrio carbinolicus]|uniref:SAM-dependent methyltransferase n=1 Tax=Solidesulfovibrio carbinolicus TaxID=296842 RepID=A0A4P6HVT1_9BACT|nr:class I SAM-dependent methyltransferase [Solidesulfovibrio carbinolicus]QAZ69638.1 SAM-dependent methyltransferase [Solidesulfovibrio carbinolicus]